MRARLFVLAALATLVVGGCALGPAIVTPDDRLPAAFEATSPEAEAIDLGRWWRAYDDPELSGLVETALARAPDARIAEARLREALAIRQGALSGFAPQGGIAASAVHSDTTLISGAQTLSLGPGIAPITLTTTGAANTDQAGFAVSWEIDLFGRARAARKAANADLLAARFEYAAARASLAANVADLLFQVRGFGAAAATARETVAVERRLLEVARDRAGAGVDREADLAAVEAEVESAEARVEGLEDQAAAARRGLLVLLGRAIDPLASLQTTRALARPPAPPRAAPGELLGRRPDVREAAARLVAASGRLDLDERALLPRFTLLPGVGATSAPGFEGQTATSFWSIGLGLAQPVLDLPRLRSVIRAQGARADQAALIYQKTVQTAYGEAEVALAGLEADEAQAERLARAEVQARRALGAARDRYAAGIEELSAVLVFERTWREADGAEVDARLRALRRSVQVYKALGGGGG
jgi:NodT family efflux transporter outer membrane factor (OMF) lipoprotein